MRFFNQFTISSRIIWSYIVLLAIIFALVFFSIYQLERVNYIATEIELCWLPATRTLGDINKGISEMRIAEYRHIAENSAGERETAAQIIEGKIRLIEKERGIYEPLIITPEERTLYNDFSKQWEVYLTEDREILALSMQNKNEEALLRLHEQSKTTFEAMNRDLERLIDINEKGGIDTSRRGDSILANSSLLIIALGVLGLVVGVIICIFTAYYLITKVSVTRKYKFVSDKR